MKLVLQTLIYVIVPSWLAAQMNSGINYLNQAPPGDVARVFAPGIISTNGFEHSSPAFSPDGSIVLWTVVSRNYRASMFEMKFENGVWSKPYRAAFADSTADDYYPSFSADGKKLYFSSRRSSKEHGIETADMRVWEVERFGEGWGKPVPIDTTVSQGRDYASSIAGDGSIYLSTSMGGGTNFNLRRSGKVNNRYAAAEVLPYNINSVDYEDGPFISPDESYLIFESQRPEGIDGSIDLYISFKNKNGEWGKAINMGPTINSAASERFAKLSPDGKFLFFGSTRNQSPDNWGFDIFWIDAGVIEELRKNSSRQDVIDTRLGNELIDALYKKDSERSSILLSQWNSKYPNDLDATILYSASLRRTNRFDEAEKLLKSRPAQWNMYPTFIMETALVKLGLKKDREVSSLLEPILASGNHQRERYKYLSNALLDMKLFDTSDEYFSKAMAIQSNRFEYHRRARAYALINEKDKAFQNIDKAIELGQTSKKEFETDADLANLRTDTRWKTLMEKLK